MGFGGKQSKEIIISKCFIYLLRSVQSDGQATSLTIVWPRKHQHSKAAPRRWSDRGWKVEYSRGQNLQNMGTEWDQVKLPFCTTGIHWAFLKVKKFTETPGLWEISFNPVMSVTTIHHSHINTNGLFIDCLQYSRLQATHWTFSPNSLSTAC